MLAEQSLRESELHLRAVLDSSPECVKVVNEDGALVEMNRAGLAMIEAETFDQVRERDICDRILHEYREDFRTALARTAAGERTTIQYEIEGLRGTRRWCEQSAVVLHDLSQPQSTAKVLAVTRDITGRVEAERRLRASEERYRSLFDTMTEAFALHEIVCDAEGRPVDYRHLDVNRAYEQLLGCPRNEIVGRLRSQQDGPNDQFWIETFGKVALGGQPLCCEYMNPDSKSFWRVKAFQTKPGEFGALFTEITQRRLAEAALRENEQRLRLFRTLVNLSSDAIFVVEPQSGQLLDVNERACQRLGYAREDLLKLRVHDIDISMRDPERWEQHVGEISQRREVLLESWQRRRDGGLVPVEISVHLVTVDTASYLIAVARDITERKRTEQLLEIFVENAPASFPGGRAESPGANQEL
jgi:PAS domain S-box-containing protein